MEQSETNPQPKIQPVVPQTVSNNHLCCSLPNCKCNTLLYCLVAFLILVILSGVAYLYRAQNQPTVPVSVATKITQPTPTTNSTADWQTYVDEKYGFSFSHPSSYSIKNTSIEPYILSVTDKLGDTYFTIWRTEKKVDFGPKEFQAIQPGLNSVNHYTGLGEEASEAYYDEKTL